jgi:hypothetical protein
MISDNEGSQYEAISDLATVDYRTGAGNLPKLREMLHADVVVG